MKRYAVMLLPLGMMVVAFLATGCVKRSTMKQYGDERYAQGVEAGRSEARPLKSSYDKCVDELTQLRGLFYGAMQDQKNARRDK